MVNLGEAGFVIGLKINIVKEEASIQV